MADVFSKRKRSQVMAAIRPHGNKGTELRLMAIMRAAHITGWRRQQRLPGKPDFVFRRERLAVFVDGCFWHGCPKHARHPRSNTAFWTRKLSSNIERDFLVGQILRRSGWRVLRFWEHHLAAPEIVAQRISRALAKKRGSPFADGSAINHQTK